MIIDTKFKLESTDSTADGTASLTAGLEPLQAFAKRASEVGGLIAKLEDLTGSAATKAVARLSKQLDEFEPAITFLGQVKSGKTTLVNAMAGWADLLPADVNPWTSVVTSLHLTPGDDRSDIGARFRFMEEGEWDRLVHKGGRLGELANRAGSEGELESIRSQIEMLKEKSRRRLGRKFEMLLGQEHEYGYFDKNLLERYICIGDDFYEDEEAATSQTQGRFADITRSADLYLTSGSAPLRMCLRDTPGVNDTFMMREQVTINAIRSSKICVIVLSAHQALTSVDMALIRMISSLKSRDVFIFVNRIDELRDPVAQVPEIEASIRQVLADHNGPEDAQIVFGSALWANYVLAGDLERMGKQSSETLLKWAETPREERDLDGSPADMVWHLSGLPKLNRMISERVVAKLGDPFLEEIAKSAVSIATGQQVANKVRIEGEHTSGSMSMHDVRDELTTLAKRHHDDLLRETDEIIGSFQARASRAHANFVERATHSLITHLETNGDDHVWSYDPTGLRMLLKSAYSVFASRAQTLARKRYEAAVVDIAELYCEAFGSAVEGIELMVPEVPEFPEPVAIAQTIALDFNDSWWVSWWRRTRGYKAFAKQFHALVSAETEDFMTQLQTIQTIHIQELLAQTIDAFFAQNRDIMIEISTSRASSDGLQRICLGKDEYERNEQVEDLVRSLKSRMGPTNWEGRYDEQ
ncbi:dynamin family protein [Sulfitobacter sp. D35]|uniref:dynamin family protein n=1 Tax=Sulfitobacter sp. D35 TaxID=3083252 RepID=UPI00296E2790|nr:dynamin family protein [Sulfitobacter sp. D35]MDW4497156.1 dynamin family protein [Sulfitobacter sp. D35]